MFCIASIAMFTHTSSIVQRLFSRAKLALDDQRKRVFLFANKRLWNIEDVDNVVATIYFFPMKILIFQELLFIKYFSSKNI